MPQKLHYIQHFHFNRIVIQHVFISTSISLCRIIVIGQCYLFVVSIKKTEVTLSYPRLPVASYRRCSAQMSLCAFVDGYDDIIKWKHLPRYWPFVRGIHRSTVDSPHTGQWRGVLMFSFICVWINSLANNREAGDFRRYRSHNDVSVMS